MQCPICGAAAKHVAENAEGLAVACPRCGDYQVAEDCLNALLRLDLEDRTAALETARRCAAPGTTAIISSVAPRPWWQRLWWRR
jgi:hypothetical protein